MAPTRTKRPPAAPGTCSIVASAALKRLFPSVKALEAHSTGKRFSDEHTEACPRCAAAGDNASLRLECFLTSKAAGDAAAAIFAPFGSKSAAFWPISENENGAGGECADASITAGHAVDEDAVVPSLAFVMAHPQALRGFVLAAGEATLPCISLLADLHDAGPSNPDLAREIAETSASRGVPLSLTASHALGRKNDPGPAIAEVNAFLSGPAWDDYASSGQQTVFARAIAAEAAATAARAEAMCRSRFSGFFDGPGGVLRAVRASKPGGASSPAGAAADGSDGSAGAVFRAWIDAELSASGAQDDSSGSVGDGDASGDDAAGIRAGAGAEEDRALVWLWDAVGSPQDDDDSGEADEGWVRHVRGTAERARRRHFDDTLTVADGGGHTIENARVRRAFIEYYKTAAVNPTRASVDAAVADLRSSCEAALAPALADFAVTCAAERVGNSLRHAERDELARSYFSALRIAADGPPREQGRDEPAPLQDEPAWNPADVLPPRPDWIASGESLLPRCIGGGWWDAGGMPIAPVAEEMRLYDARREAAGLLLARAASDSDSGDCGGGGGEKGLPWPPVQRTVPRFFAGADRDDDAPAVAAQCAAPNPIYEHIFSQSLLAMRSSMARALHARLAPGCPFDPDAVPYAREVAEEHFSRAWGRERWAEIAEKAEDDAEAARERASDAVRGDRAAADALRASRTARARARAQAQQDAQPPGKQLGAQGPGSGSASPERKDGQGNRGGAGDAGTGGEPARGGGGDRDSCAACGEPLAAADGGPSPLGAAVKVSEERSFHRACLRCEGPCGSLIAESGAAVVSGKVMCVPCMKIVTDQVCFGCGKEFGSEGPDAAPGGVLATSRGRKYHRACFVCRVCGVSVRGRYFEAEDGSPHCEAHRPASSSLTESCASCGAQVRPGEATVQIQASKDAPAEVHHRGCVGTCAECGVDVANDGRRVDGRTLCAAHSGGRGKGTGTGDGKPGDGSAGDGKPGDGSPGDGSAGGVTDVARKETDCAECGADLSEGQYLSALGKRFCHGCFKCAECGVVLTSGNGVVADGRALCAKCGSSEAACASPKCGKAITGPHLIVEIDGRKCRFHKECFVCSVCSAAFESGFFKNPDGHPVCKDHVAVTV